ncbi:MAG: metallophosphoesterase [Tannerella sp.]|jgi:predicted MPP superfamily phosphohydrolase|nr:metallophosphoesterase [Tannerella sp.]
MKVFLQSIFGQILFSSYILWRGRQALPKKKSCQIPFVLALILEILIFFTGYLFYDYLPDSIFIPLMLICNTWYIASLYITIALLTLELFRLINKRWAWYPVFIHLYWDKTKIILFFVIAIGITGLMIFGYRNVRYPSVQHVYLTIPKTAEGRDSLNIVMTSDWHIGEMIRKKQVQHIVQLCNEQNPDIILIVGDIIDYETRFAEKEHIEEDLQQLKAPLGVFMTLGNHEYRANRFAKLRWIEKTGIMLLVDSVIAPPDSSFYLVGRDDYINHRNRASLKTLMQQVDTLKPVIVLDHQPNRLNEIVMNKADLGLHGHTHNGQVWPYSLFLHLVYECPYGYYRKGDTQFFISSGVGIAGPPYRIGTHSEIVVLHIRFNATQTTN